MSAPPVITIDYETLPIDKATYPPKPVGVAIKWPGKPGRYYAFGHRTGNNCTVEDARRALYDAYLSGLPVLFHNAKFDLEVMAGRNAMDFPFFEKRPWSDKHDTTYLLFLAEPHALSHALKPSAERLLGWASEERDEIAEWCWTWRANLEQASGIKVTRKNGQPPRAGNPMMFMQYVPGDMAGKYAVGDVERTEALFNLLWPYVVEECGMGAAYDRERQLLPIFMENERDGIRVDTELLAAETVGYSRTLDFVENRIRQRLNAPSLNFDADQDYARALIAAGVVRESDFPRTEKRGDFRVSKDTLTPDLFTDPLVASAVGYRNRLKTCLTMFMEPWLEQAQRTGFVSTNWNSTRGEAGGTRTGRPSTSDPNFLNISKAFEGRPDGYVHPDFLNVARLPLVRKYLLPDEGGLWGHRDFSGQELRVFAHFESGPLHAQYLADPGMDPHGWVRDVMVGLIPALAATDQGLLRTKVKVTNFQSLYGGGVGAIQRGLKISRKEAEEFKAFHDKALPGRVTLNDEIKRIVRRDEPIRTWGGRLYFVEEPRVVDGRRQTFEYKLINYLVQGSAADLTKQALIDWHGHSHRDPYSRFLVAVYDEANLTIPADKFRQQMKLLKEVMEAPRLTVPMLSDGKVGRSWGSTVKYDDAKEEASLAAGNGAYVDF